MQHVTPAVMPMQLAVRIFTSFLKTCHPTEERRQDWRQTAPGSSGEDGQRQHYHKLSLTLGHGYGRGAGVVFEAGGDRNTCRLPPLPVCCREAGQATWTRLHLAGGWSRGSGGSGSFKASQLTPSPATSPATCLFLLPGSGEIDILWICGGSLACIFALCHCTPFGA